MASRGLLAVLLAVYACWRVHDGLLLTGLPLSPQGLAACVGIALAWLLSVAPPRRWIVAAAVALCAIKMAAAPFVLPAGWAGKYYSNDRFEGSPERSLDFLGQPWTRIDRVLRFEGDTFPLHFLNEIRYNYTPDRRAPAFSVEYAGSLTLDRADTLTVQVAATNGFDVSIDGRSALARRIGEDDRVHVQRSVEVPLGAGPHQVTVRYISPSSKARKLDVALRLGTNDRVGVRPWGTTETEETRSRWSRRLLALTDAIALSLIATWLVLAARSWWQAAPAARRAPVQHGAAAAIVAALGVLGVGLSVAWHAIPSACFLISTGNDGFAYAEYARLFLRDSFLLNASNLTGQPLLYTVGYHLTLSLVHVLFGESLWQVYFVQDWLLWATVVLTATTAARIGGLPAGLIAFAIGVYFRTSVFWPSLYVARESVVVFLNVALVFVFTVRSAMTVRRAAATGALAGINFLTDPINLLVLPALVWLVQRAASPEQRRRCAIVFVAAWIVPASTVAVRNLAVTGVPTLMPTEGAPTLWAGNKPPPEVYPSPPPDGTFYAAVWHYAQTEPRHLATEFLKKTVYSLGFYSSIVWPFKALNQISIVIFVTWICAALGLTAAARKHPAVQLLILLAIVRWTSMVVFIAHHRYGTTLAMLLIPLAAIGLLEAWRWRPLVAVGLVAVVMVDHVRASPGLGGQAAFTSAQYLASPSYAALRRRVDWRLPSTARLQWTFPADTAAWTPRPQVGVVDDETPTYQFLADGEGGMISPALALPAPLVDAIEIDAGFTGWSHVANVAWYRKGITEPTVAWFRVDRTGRPHTYRIPVWRSTEWDGEIERLELRYEGDTIAPRRIELKTYPDVFRRTAAVPPGSQD